MSLLSENVVPGKQGKVFGTNAKEHDDLLNIKSAIQNIDGVKDVILNEDIFPKELTVHTSSVVSIKEIEDAAMSVGFHVIPKKSFPL